MESVNTNLVRAHVTVAKTISASIGVTRIMVNVNPPVDREEAIKSPVMDLRMDDGHRFYVGREKTADTLPEETHFRFIHIVEPDGRTWSGYLWLDGRGEVTGQ